MVDYFALAVTHALLALAAWRLLRRDDLDREVAPPSEPPADPSAIPPAASGHPAPGKLPPRSAGHA